MGRVENTNMNVRPPSKTPRSKRPQSNVEAPNGHSNGTTQSAEELYHQASEYAQQSQAEEALECADALWAIVKDRTTSEQVPALTLRGEILLELGESKQARQCFEEAARLDPDGAIEGPLGAGAEKFMWLAQLSEDGGKDSLHWYEKGVTVLQHQVAELERGQIFGLDEDTLLVFRAEKKARLANALCGVIELYMTDLSWEEDAEDKCEQLIMQAIAVEDDTSAEVYQTLASIRLSQDRQEDAQAALKRSYGLWKDLDAADTTIPDFAARISLGRLLMEAEMQHEALEVVQRLVREDDESVEAWYLGGWCHYLIAQAIEARRADDLSQDMTKALGRALGRSRKWLTQAVKLYEQLDYEDDRLRSHALELLAQLETLLGSRDDGEDDSSSEEEWSGLGAANGNQDHDMEDA